MIITARQLEDLHRAAGANGHVTLPYRARLTPLAADFIRARKLMIGYSEVDGPCSTLAKPEKDSCKCGSGKCDDGKCSETCNPAGVKGNDAAAPVACATQSPGGIASGRIFWWCDGPSGPAKAALTGFANPGHLRPLDLPADPKRIVAVIKKLALEVKGNRASGAILLVQSGATAIVYANRCPSLRAVLGTCLEAVEQGIGQVGANVLIIEYPHKTLQQMRNLIGRFLRGGPGLSEDVKRNFAELIVCA